MTDLTPKPEATYFGVPVSHMGDDGEWMIALGHHTPRCTCRPV